MNHRRELVEVSLPLDEINAQSARGKSNRQGHPSTRQLWRARRPLIATRCVIFAQLVEGPSNRIDEFCDKYRTEGLPDDKVETLAEVEVTVVRLRLNGMLAALANRNSIEDEGLWDAAREEIGKSRGGVQPAILDSFADVTLTIKAEHRDDFDESVARAISENARTLYADANQFEQG